MIKILHRKLSGLIFALIAIASLAMLANSFYASYRVQQKMLIDNTLEANHVYAMKLAASTEAFLGASMQRLAYSASLLSNKFDDATFTSDEVTRLLLETDSFNSIVIVDKNGIVRASAPSMLGVNGLKLTSFEVQQTIQKPGPNISKPYLSALNNLIVSISQPIFKDGEYQGYVGGAIYLYQHNILHSLLEEHYYKDGSYIYVVDSSRRLLYHPNKKRLGTIVDDNELIDLMAFEKDGTRHMKNSQGIEMLAAFAVVQSSGWAIVTQRPVEQTIAPLRGLTISVIKNTAPLAIFTFILVGWLAVIISRPLEQLAVYARRINDADTANCIRQVKSWYFEVAELKRAMLTGLSILDDRIVRLNADAETDPLTGLLNRRSLDTNLELLTTEKTFFSIIALDIDHFKKVNDQYGHDAGDHVLEKLAETMRECSRNNDILYRVGGEEFLILLPNTKLDAAEAAAERLRQKVEQTLMHFIAITISLGVARWTLNMPNVTDVLKNADKKLYEAKASGRNCVRVFDPKGC